MFGVSFSELLIILFIAGFFLKPEEMKAIIIKCRKLYWVVKQEMHIFESFGNAEITSSENNLMDVNEEEKTKH